MARIHALVSDLLFVVIGALIALSAMALLAPHDVTSHSATVYVAPTCDTVVGWDATVQARGDQAQAAWQALVDQGWTNPADGTVTLLVQPGCA